MKPLEYKGYLGSVEYEDTYLYGKILLINDLVTFEGDSIKELKAAFEESVDDYLATCQELGKEPDKPFKGTFNIRMSPEWHKDLSAIACREETSLNALILRAVKHEYFATA